MITEKILLDNMEVREVYDMNSIHDWYRYEFISLIKGISDSKNANAAVNFLFLLDVLTANTVNVFIRNITNYVKKSVRLLPLPNNMKMITSIRYTRKPTAGWIPEKERNIFQNQSSANGAKKPEQNESSVKMAKLHRKNFRLGWMKISADK